MNINISNVSSQTLTYAISAVSVDYIAILKTATGFAFNVPYAITLDGALPMIKSGVISYTDTELAGYPKLSNIVTALNNIVMTGNRQTILINVKDSTAITIKLTAWQGNPQTWQTTTITQEQFIAALDTQGVSSQDFLSLIDSVGASLFAA